MWGRGGERRGEEVREGERRVEWNGWKRDWLQNLLDVSGLIMTDDGCF